MPTNRSSTGLINAAVPGFSRLALALGNGQGAYDDGADREVSRQTKLAQAAAETWLSNEKAAQVSRSNQLSAPAAMLSRSMRASGVPIEAQDDVIEYLDRGRISKYDLPRDIPGPTMEKPEWADNSNLSALAKRIAASEAVLAGGAKGAADYFKGEDQLQHSALTRAIVEGRLAPDATARGLAIAKASPLFHASDNGAVLNLYGGGLDTANPMAGASIYERNQKGAQAKAGALENEAQARASAALAEQRRTITAAGKSGPGGKVPVGYRYTTGEAGEARLEPIPGGPKDPNAQTGKPLPASAAKGYLENQNSLRQVQKALSLLAGEKVGDIQGDKAATGWKGYAPDFILNRMDSAGNATRAAVADIGSLKIHDRSGAAVTAAETPRLKPFVPSATDPPDVVRTKLKLFEENYRAMVEDAAEFYKASGFNVPTLKERSDPPAGGFKYLGKE